MDEWLIILICFCAAAVPIVIALVVRAKNKNKKKDNSTRVEPVVVIDGVRYTESDVTENADGSVKATLRMGDTILERGREVVVSKKGLLAGKYTILSTDENTDKINIRLSGYVREYSHMSSIVLNEGDTICAVSHTVILR